MKKVSLILLCLSCAFMSFAQIRGSEIKVLVSPDHDNWQYTPDDSCTFTVQVIKSQNPLQDITVDYEMGPEMYPDRFGKDVKLKDGKLVLKGSMDKPGFYRCKIRTRIGEKTYEGLATAAYAPDRICPVTAYPDDFREFWQQKLANARQTPLNPQMTLLPERCTETDLVYQISFRVQQAASRFYGILSIPKKPGKYPALLRVPGAGIRPYQGDTYTAPGQLITLEVGIHGIPVTLERSFYDNLMGGALNCYWNFCKEDPAGFYYNRVITGALRAVDFICQLPEFDGKTLGVTGSSQGGALSVITAALDPRVTFFAALHPALCDHEGFTQSRAGGWPHYFYKQPATPEALNTVRYYDTANFARCVQVPGWFSWGYNDEVCPPTSMYAAYNSISSPKELSLYLESGHFWYQEQYDQWQQWLRSQLNL